MCKYCVMQFFEQVVPDNCYIFKFFNGYFLVVKRLSHLTLHLAEIPCFIFFRARSEFQDRRPDGQLWYKRLLTAVDASI